MLDLFILRVSTYVYHLLSKVLYLPMLDDLKFIHQRDGQDALGIAEKQWQQLEHEFELPDLRSQISDLATSSTPAWAAQP